MKKNVIVGQSGGPTAVINASLAGVYKTAKDMGADTIYGMRYGTQGLLEKKIVDLGEKIRNDMDVELLKRTPASFLGSCRYKGKPRLVLSVHTRLLGQDQGAAVRNGCVLFGISLHLPVGSRLLLDTEQRLFAYKDDIL